MVSCLRGERTPFPVDSAHTLLVSPSSYTNLMLSGLIGLHIYSVSEIIGVLFLDLKQEKKKRRKLDLRLGPSLISAEWMNDIILFAGLFG